MKLAGSRILLESLAREGVDTLFGNEAGFAPLLQCPLRTVRLDRTEAVIHAADGYARATGRVGVALAGYGPEAIGAVAGIAAAFRDAAPLVVFFFHPAPHPMLLEDVDLFGVVRPCAKHAYLVRSLEDLPRVIRQALHLARTGRPGPVVVDVSETMLGDEAVFEWPEKLTLRGYNPAAKPHRNQLRRAVAELEHAERPLLCVGGGAVQSGAAEALTRLARTYGLPVCSTLMGLGAFPGDDPLWLGMTGLCGTPAANRAAAEADVILAVGLRFDRRTLRDHAGHEFGAKAHIIHLDMEPAGDHPDLNVNVPVPGDCRLSLECLAELLEKFAKDAPKIWPERRSHWLAGSHGEGIEEKTARSSSDKLSAAEVLDALNRLAKPDAIVTTGTGRHQMAVATGRVFREPRTLLTPGGLAAMGYGLAAAVGAQSAFPHRQVIHVTGDGSLLRSLPDAEALTRLPLPIRIIVLDNRETRDTGPDLSTLTEGFRLETLKVLRREDLLQTLKRAFAATGPVAVVIPVEASPRLADVPLPERLEEKTDAADGGPLSLS